MASYPYEVMFILDSNVYTRNPSAVSEKIDKMITDLGGEVLASRLWNEQKLAYPIKGRFKGTYWLTYCRLDGSQLRNFTRACQLNDSILRHLTVRVDERLINTLVDAAKGHVVPTFRSSTVTVNVVDDESPDEEGETDSAEVATSLDG